MKNSCIILLIISLLWLLTSCDEQRVFDLSMEIPQKSWDYDSIVPFDVLIKDTTITYNVYLNVRHSNTYLFRNLWVKIHTTFPSGEQKEQRVDLPLANKEGKWHGTGLGDVRSAQIQLQSKAKMPDIGMYRFEIEQNMRQNPLREVMDIGLRIEKAE